MAYGILQRILDQEGSAFYEVSKKWQPKNLIPDPYRRNLLKDAQGRFNLLSEAEEEFRSLTRAHLYVQILRRMRLTIKEAQFAWRTDDLRFLVAVTRFFKDYGIMLRNLKDDKALGKF